jgi:flagellar hook-associated protein 1 FlgK
MALTSGLNMALSGMMTTELKTNLSSQNITNADKAGYTRKELQVQYMTTNAGSTPVSGLVVGTADQFLVKAVVRDISTYSRQSSISASLDYYNSQMGSTAGTNTFSSYLDNLYATLQYLATNPETSANKSEVITTVESLTGSLRDVSANIQKLRLDAEQRIGNSIENINSLIDQIAALNNKITDGSNNDASLAEYQDTRNNALLSLSAELDIQYFYTTDNRLQIYTKSGQALLLSDAHHINYTTTNVVNGTISYPVNFSAIDLDGSDLTTTLSGGKLAGLIELRDTIYPDEQAKLNEFSSVLQTQVNTLLNTGASLAARNNITGSLQGLTGATAFTATGSLRVAVMDNAGNVINYSDINLAAMTTVNDVLTALNGVAGVTAAINADGELSITASPSTNGIAINPLNSAVTSSTGQSLSQYFGLNDLLIGTSAENIQVNSYLTSNPELLAIGQLSSSATLAAGDRGVNRGDGSIADALADLLNNNVSFAAAGDFAAQSNTLQRYAQAFMSAAASNADLAQKAADTSQEIFNASNDLLTSSSGVNIDEETAKLLQYQNQYEAGAQVVSTIQEMLQTLIDAMR